MHYTLIGHLTKDLRDDGHFTIGGTAYYAGLGALALGASVSVVTRCEDLLEHTFRANLPLFAPASTDLHLHIQPSAVSTTFDNQYDSAGARIQYMRARADSITPQPLDPAPDVVHFAPLISEIEAGWLPYATQTGAKIGVTPQGWLREVDSEGRVHPKNWRVAEAFIRAAWAVVFSEEDLGRDEAEIAALLEACRVGICTRADKPATLSIAGRRHTIPPFPTLVTHPTGAGDVFAAAFFIHYAETDDPLQAARFAHAAASWHIRGRLAGRDAILNLMQQGV